MNKKYDLIAILGYGFSKDWKLSLNTYHRMKIGADLYKKGVAKKIAVCGRWSINYDLKNIVPPTTEAEEMKKVLVDLGIPEEDILKEDWSKDTIGNAFFLKTKIVKPLSFEKILVTCADYHLERVKFIFNKVFEESYLVDFFPVTTKSVNNKDFIALQREVLQMQKNFLKEMKRGDDSFLEKRLYNDPYYKKQRPVEIAKTAMGRVSSNF